MQADKYINSLISKVTEYQVSKDELNKKIEALNQKESKLDSLKIDLEDSIKLKEKALSEKESKLDSLKIDLEDSIKRKEKKLNKELNLCNIQKSENSALNNQLTNLNHDISNLNNEINRLHQEIFDRDSKIHGLLNSTSWKITASLRLITPFLKHLKKNTFFIMHPYKKYKEEKEIVNFISSSSKTNKSVVALYKLLNK